ncbi:MAG: hypothetical protein ACKVQQ_06815, partial [Burkholderiales bacterium]
LVNQLLGGPQYGEVVAVTRLPLPSTTRKLVAHHVPEELALHQAAWPRVQDAYFVIGERHSYYRRDEAYRALSIEEVMAAAGAARSAGVSRLALVSPVAVYAHSAAFRKSLMNLVEYELFALGFQTLALVRPAAPDKFVRHGNFGKRLAAFLLRQVQGLMPESYQPPSARLVALAAARSLAVGSEGLVIIDADDVRGVAGQ